MCGTLRLNSGMTCTRALAIKRMYTFEGVWLTFIGVTLLYFWFVLGDAEENINLAVWRTDPEYAAPEHALGRQHDPDRGRGASVDEDVGDLLVPGRLCAAARQPSVVSAHAMPLLSRETPALALHPPPQRGERSRNKPALL